MGQNEIAILFPDLGRSCQLILLPVIGHALPAVNIKCVTMPGAGHAGPLHPAFGQRPVRVRAAVRDRVDRAVDAEQGDRLARDMWLSCFLEKEVKRRQARIVSAAGEGTGADDPASIAMRQMVDVFAEFERNMIAARTAAAFSSSEGLVVASVGRSRVMASRSPVSATTVVMLRSCSSLFIKCFSCFSDQWAQ